MRVLMTLALLVGLVSLTTVDQADSQDHARRMPTKHGRGRVARKDLKQIRAAHKVRHARRGTRLPKATTPQFDAVALGWTCKVIDQGQCGSCWDFSGTEMVTSGFIKQGSAPGGSVFLLSCQYTLDCYSNGGCNGDDNVTVLQHAKATGLPEDKTYGPYRANEGTCRYKPGMTLYQIQDWGYCTQGDDQGVAKIQDIKDHLVAYGMIGCAVDAGGMDGYSSGVISGSGHNIDHDVAIVAWDDTKGRHGAWKVQNSWGTSWGESGYCWMEYGSYDIGTEAVWCTVGGEKPPGPTPPGPVPDPVPPPVVSYQLELDGQLSSGDLVIRSAGWFTSRISGHAPGNIPAGTYTLTPAGANKMGLAPGPCPCGKK